MSGAECVCRILAWLDQRSDPRGDISQCQPEDVELAAGWTGGEGVLYAALVSTGWIDEEGLERRWHDYGSFNGNTIRDRNKKRGLRPGTGRGHRSDLAGDEVGDKVGDKVGASGSGYGSDADAEKKQKTPSESAAPKPRRRSDPMVLLLAQRLGSGKKVCNDQIRALRAAGWTDERLSAAIESHAKPGLAPWTWTAKVNGTNSARNGALTADDFDTIQGAFHDAERGHDHPAGAARLFPELPS
jgi:hypothetical protein